MRGIIGDFFLLRYVGFENFELRGIVSFCKRILNIVVFEVFGYILYLYKIKRRV